VRGVVHGFSWSRRPAEWYDAPALARPERPGRHAGHHEDMGRYASAFRLAVVLGFALLGSACADKDTDTAYLERPAEEIYNSAMDKVLDSDYQKASKDFDEVDRQHPYSVWATKAQLMSAYSLYQASKYDQAVVDLDRFIQLHPGNRDTAYAYYLKALCYYVQITDVGRDQKTTEQALKAMDEVAKRFPDSKYARDARLKIDLTRDHLAGKEMDIGRYYERQGNYLAAINRFRRVVDNYQTTTHVPEALHRLTECYLALGIVDEAKTTAAVLGHNYPGSEWYVDSYALLTGVPQQNSVEQKGWVSRVISSVF
jgi:outer membrane protein assembly factor BamD